jgi:hypothetical protein
MSNHAPGLDNETDSAYAGPAHIETKESDMRPEDHPARTRGRDTGRYPGRIPRATARLAEALLDRSPAFVYHIIEQI